MQILDQTLSRMRYSTQGRILAELALVRISHLEDLDELSRGDRPIAVGLPITVASPREHGDDHRLRLSYPHPGHRPVGRLRRRWNRLRRVRLEKKTMNRP